MDSIDEKLFGTDDRVRACASDGRGGAGDRAYYDAGSCLCPSVFECPFQSKKYRVVTNGIKSVVCERYHPKFQNGQKQE